jgi:hypothetical protein
LRAIRKSLERRKGRLEDRLMNWSSYREEIMADLTEEEIAEID